MQNKKSYNIKEMYEWYISNVEKYSAYDIPFSLYKEICYEYFKELKENILSGKTVELPYRLGIISVIKYRLPLTKGRKVGIDYQLSKKYGKKILLTNEHTNGYSYKIKWLKGHAIFKNKRSYKFVPPRDMKRTLAKLIKTEHKDYSELNN